MSDKLTMGLGELMIRGAGVVATTGEKVDQG